MQVQVNNKTYNIPEDTIKNYMKSLDISEDEAIQMWLDDRGITVNEEVERLTQKAKQNKTDKIIVQSKVEKKKTERKPKENPLKQQIIAYLYEFLAKNDTLQGLKIENPTKTIDFIVEDKHFSLNLVEHRAKKS